MPSTRRARIFLPNRHQIGLLVAFLLALLVFLFLMAWLSARTAAAAPLVDPDDHGPWARDAVATLTAKGLVDGYPDGTYKGDRSMTRDEAASLLDTLQNLLEQQDRDLATKQDLGEVERAVNSLHDALEGTGVREDSTEQQVERLEQRVDGTPRPSL